MPSDEFLHVAILDQLITEPGEQWLGGVACPELVRNMCCAHRTQHGLSELHQLASYTMPTRIHVHCQDVACSIDRTDMVQMLMHVIHHEPEQLVSASSEQHECTCILQLNVCTPVHVQCRHVLLRWTALPVVMQQLV